MSISDLSAQAKAATSLEPRKDLKAVKKLVLAAFCRPKLRELCPLCGEQPKYIAATLWFYGDGDGFQVSVPICGCVESDERSEQATENPRVQ
jgi:hypothetical protein